MDSLESAHDCPGREEVSPSGYSGAGLSRSSDFLIEYVGWYGRAGFSVLSTGEELQRGPWFELSTAEPKYVYDGGVVASIALQ